MSDESVSSLQANEYTGIQFITANVQQRYRVWLKGEIIRFCTTVDEADAVLRQVRADTE